MCLQYKSRNSHWNFLLSCSDWDDFESEWRSLHSFEVEHCRAERCAKDSKPADVKEGGGRAFLELTPSRKEEPSLN